MRYYPTAICTMGRVILPPLGQDLGEKSINPDRRSPSSKALHGMLPLNSPRCYTFSDNLPFSRLILTLPTPFTPPY